MLDFLKNGLKGIIDSVGSIVDNVVTTDEERLRIKHKVIAEIFELQNKAEQLYYDDLDSARERDTKVNESEHASWLSKNISHVLAIVVVLSSTTLFALTLFGHIPESAIVIKAQSYLEAASLAVIYFYFGSSRSATVKDETILSELRRTAQDKILRQ
jgi:hypothetical protein